MKKIAKKITAIMLSLVMVFGCIPSLTNEASANAGNDKLKELVDYYVDHYAQVRILSSEYTGTFSDSITYSLDEPITVDTYLDLNLNAKELSSDNCSSIFKVADGGVLRLSNGTIKNTVVGDDETDAAIVVEDGGILILSNMTISNCTSGIYTEYGSKIIILDTNITNNDYGLFSEDRIYFGGTVNINSNTEYDLKAGYNIDVTVSSRNDLFGHSEVDSPGLTGGNIKISCDELDNNRTGLAFVCSSDENNETYANYFAPQDSTNYTIIVGSNKYIRLIKTAYDIDVNVNKEKYFSVDDVKQLDGTSIKGDDCTDAREATISVVEDTNDCFEIIEIRIDDAKVLDYVKSLKIDGIDILSDKVDTSDVEVLKSAAKEKTNKMAWFFSNNKITVAKLIKLSDKFEAKYSGLVVGAKLDDVKVDQFTFNGVEDKQQGMSIYEVTDQGDNVKAILNSETFEANKKYLICSNISSKTANKFDNAVTYINGELITNILAALPDVTKEKETGYIIGDRGIYYVYVFTPSNPTSSGGSKKYKANDNDTAEKVSGSGKKGSTRTIVPEEGRKVSNVTVTDKKGNPIEVEMNEDGTYSFTQPASDVIINVDYASREIKMEVGTIGAYVDGVGVNEYVTPKVRNNETMLPVRFIAENLGAKVDWNEKEPNMIYITRGDKKIEIKLGSNVIKVNGEETTLDSASFAEGNRTYVPFDLIEKALNAVVEFDTTNANEIVIKEI